MLKGRGDLHTAVRRHNDEKEISSSLGKEIFQFAIFNDFLTTEINVREIIKIFSYFYTSTQSLSYFMF